jgi:hypothetical protein
VVAIAPSTVIAGGTAGIFSYDAGVLARTSTTAARGLWGMSATDVWAAGAGVMRSTAGGWVSAGLPSSERAISGTSASNVYVVGATSAHFNGTLWTQGPFDDPELAAVCASTTIGVFAAGQHGALEYWSGTALEPMVSRSTTDLHAVRVIDNLVFIAGDDGALQLMIFHR